MWTAPFQTCFILSGRSDHVARNKVKKSNKRFNKSRRDANVIDFNDYTPSRHRKKRVEIIPRNEAQEEYIFSIEDNTISFGVGPAGTGKTLIATLMGIQALKNGEVDKIVVTRPAVSVSGEEHGFLPGTLIEKMAPWTRPIFDVLDEYYNPKQVVGMIEDGTIEISPLAYMRGRTFKHSFIIFDEAQNSTIEQMKMVLTRIGDGTKMVITGDLDQSDRSILDKGLHDFILKYNKSPINNLNVVQFTHKDIERHPVISDILSLYNKD